MIKYFYYILSPSNIMHTWCQKRFFRSIKTRQEVISLIKSFSRRFAFLSFLLIIANSCQLVHKRNRGWRNVQVKTLISIVVNENYVVSKLTLTVKLNCSHQYSIRLRQSLFSLIYQSEACWRVEPNRYIYTKLH